MCVSHTAHQTLYNPIDCSPPVSSVHGILQARILGSHSLLQGIFPTQGLNPGLAGRFSTIWATSGSGSESESHSVQFSSFRLLSRVQHFAIPWTEALQISLSITNSLSLLKLTSIESVMPSNHLILCLPLLLIPSIFPSIRVFCN